jgi:hypothetical protein
MDRHSIEKLAQASSESKWNQQEHHPQPQQQHFQQQQQQQHHHFHNQPWLKSGNCPLCHIYNANTN